MPLKCFQSSFGSIQLTVWEEMSFEEYQDGRGGHLGYRNSTILAIQNLYVAHQVSAQSDLRFGWRCRRPSLISEWNDFSNSESLCHSDASHQVIAQSDFDSILAILNLYVAPMSSIKFQLNPTYGLHEDVVWRISRWSQSWISEWNDSEQFWISMSLRCISSSFSSIWLMVWETSFEEFQDGVTILAILNPYVSLMPPMKFRLNLTYGLGGDVVWRISRWPPWQPSWISERNDFNNSEFLCRSDASHQVSAQSDIRFGRRCR